MMRPQKLFLGLGLFSLIFGFGLLSVNVSAKAPALFSWQIQVIDSTNDVGQFPSLALQPGTEKPYISYHDITNADLKLAFPILSGGDCGPGNSWSCNSLAFQNNVDFGGFSSLTFNSLGEWGIVYSNYTSGANAFRGIPAPGGTELFWSDIDDSNTLAFLNSSALDLDEVTHVSYAAIDSETTNTYIKHAEYVGSYGNCGNGAWQCDIIVETSLESFAVYNSLFFILNMSNIVYRDINRQLSLASSVGEGNGNCGPNDSWSCWSLDTTSIVTGIVSVYTDGNNYIGIAYIDNNKALRYAEYVGTGGNCGTDIFLNAFRCTTIETVDSPGLPNGSQFLGTSIGRSNGSPVIAYNDIDDQGNSVLKIAYRKVLGNCGPLVGFFRTWQCDVVDDGGDTNDVGYYPSLKVDTEGNVHIAYYDYTANDLKYAFSEVPIGPTPTPTNTPPPAALIYLPFILR